MPTVMLTTRCPNACPWCFARAKMAAYRARGITEMGWGDVAAVAGFYERNGLRSITLLGGEPMLHSRFVDVLDRLGSRGFEILVATSGNVAETLVDEVAAAGIGSLSFSLNCTSYFDGGPKRRRRVDHFLRRIGRPVTLSYTVSERDLGAKEPYAVVDRMGLIMKFGLRPHLQFQIAVPSRGNAGFIPAGRYGEAVALLRSWFGVLNRNGVTYGLECHSVPRCVIPVEGEGAGLFCSRCPGFMIDIGPGLTVWPCFPLSDITAPLGRFGNFREIREHFRQRVADVGRGCEACVGGVTNACGDLCAGFNLPSRPPADAFSARAASAQPA